VYNVHETQSFVKTAKSSWLRWAVQVARKGRQGICRKFGRFHSAVRKDIEDKIMGMCGGWLGGTMYNWKLGTQYWRRAVLLQPCIG